MSKRTKYILCGFVCVIAILALFKIFGFSFYASKAEAFEWEKSVNVYLNNRKMGSSDDCSKVFPVSRTILNAETFGPGALEALLKGVSAEEKTVGYSTSLNDKVLIQKFEIKDKVAYVDFNQRFSEVGGSCKVTAIKSQIENTLNNLPDIDSVVISVNGKTEGILEP
jgi:spore germination protein GerM